MNNINAVQTKPLPNLAEVLAGTDKEIRDAIRLLRSGLLARQQQRATHKQARKQMADVNYVGHPIHY